MQVHSLSSHHAPAWQHALPSNTSMLPSQPGMQTEIACSWPSAEGTYSEEFYTNIGLVATVGPYDSRPEVGELAWAGKKEAAGAGGAAAAAAAAAGAPRATKRGKKGKK